MVMFTKFSKPARPDWEDCMKAMWRQGTPEQVHNIELFHDGEVHRALVERFEIGKDLSQDDPHYGMKMQIAFARTMGYDYVGSGAPGGGLPMKHVVADDTSAQMKRQTRTWMEEGKGPITSWEDFEKYPWPDPKVRSTAALEWFSENLPDDMMIVGAGGVGNFDEFLCWLFGYETLCYAIYEQPDLVEAVRQKIEELMTSCMEVYLQFPRVKAVWGADDMGFKTGLLIGTDATKELVLPGHKKIAAMCHTDNRAYMLHSCGNLSDIYEDLIEDVKIDAKHSFEDVIEDVRDVKKQYGDRLTLLGGIDVDFLCRADEKAIRERVRDTIDVCQPGGGWFLGSGNSVANYIPLDSFLVMMDEGRSYGTP